MFFSGQITSFAFFKEDLWLLRGMGTVVSIVWVVVFKISYLLQKHGFETAQFCSYYVLVSKVHRDTNKIIQFQGGFCYCIMQSN